MSLKLQAGILVTNYLNNGMKNKVIYLIYKEVLNNKALEENKSERTFETPCCQ